MERIKYPKTPHLPYSPGILSEDDKLISDDHFIGKEVVVTEKLDGENTTLYRDYYHARSVESKSHPSQSFVKGLWGKIRYLIPVGWRICGENMYAKHHIYYNNLDSYFYIHSVWNELNNALSWIDIYDWCYELDLPHVPFICFGEYNDILKVKIENLYDTISEKNEIEGYVIRLASEFHYNDFGKSVAKYRSKVFPNDNPDWRRGVFISNDIHK